MLPPSTPSATVYVVDDDEAIRDALTWMLSAQGLTARALPSGEDFLAETHPTLRGCLLLDIRMQGMSGLALFDRLQEEGYDLPVIFLTGHGDVPMAVGAIKKGAFDFLEKPFDDGELLMRVRQALESDQRQSAARARSASIQSRLEDLTPRERQIMEMILQGKANKVIADELSISMRTVEVHRANLFDKMGVRTAVELAQLLKGP